MTSVVWTDGHFGVGRLPGGGSWLCFNHPVVRPVSDTPLLEFVGQCAAVSELCLAGDDRKGGGKHNTVLQLTSSPSPRVLFVYTVASIVRQSVVVLLLGS